MVKQLNYAIKPLFVNGATGSFRIGTHADAPARRDDFHAGTFYESSDIDGNAVWIYQARTWKQPSADWVDQRVTELGKGFNNFS